MGLLDKFTLFAISFVLGMVTTSGIMTFTYDDFFDPLFDTKINFTLNNGIESPFNDKKLECNRNTSPAKIRIKELPKLLMEKELIKLAVFESVTSGKVKPSSLA